MSDDWQVGDKALCVDASPSREFGAPLVVVGQAYTVLGVVPAHVGWCGSPCPGCCGLYLDGADHGAAKHGFAGHRFRKILPDKHEPCEEEFVTLLKRKRVRA